LVTCRIQTGNEATKLTPNKSYTHDVPNTKKIETWFTKINLKLPKNDHSNAAMLVIIGLVNLSILLDSLRIE